MLHRFRVESHIQHYSARPGEGGRLRENREHTLGYPVHIRSLRGEGAIEDMIHGEMLYALYPERCAGI